VPLNVGLSQWFPFDAVEALWRFILAEELYCADTVPPNGFQKVE
jgi:hypothetical protein